MSNPKTYLGSDYHIGHTDIHNKWRTQFCSQSDHDEHMVQCINSVVRPKDTFKVLGDFIVGIDNLHYLNQINGTIHWILGNHDPKITSEILSKYKRVSYVGGAVKYKGCFLTHIPIHPQELEYRNVIMNIHGHVHHKEHNNLGDKYYNVCADIMGYYPREFHSIMKEVGKEC